MYCKLYKNYEIYAVYMEKLRVYKKNLNFFQSKNWMKAIIANGEIVSLENRNSFL